MEKQEAVYRRLDALGIAYEVAHHRAVFTMDEMEALDPAFKEDVVKSLFLRDDRGDAYYLVVLGKDRKPDLRALRHGIGSRPLSFASERRLEEVIGLRKGEVTPFGILNDEDRRVTVVLDRALCMRERVAVHPNDNRATVWLKMDDLLRLLRENGHRVLFVEA